MTENSEQSKVTSLAEKLTRIDVIGFEVLPGEDNVEMLYMQGKLICGVDYALLMGDEQLKALIDETVVAGEQ
ncbi:MAG: hypothetical protein WB562_20430 [Candidatus Sulfotelmatobacter sp.]